MNLWQKRSAVINHGPVAARHEFVIGPFCKCAAFQQGARLYYCIRCKWSFFVAGSKVAVLDEDGTALTGEESLRRFKTFENGPCPVLEAFASAAAPPASVEPQFRRKHDESSHLAARHLRSWSGRPRPVLRVLGRLREDLGN